MDCTSTQLSYGETGYFSNIVTSYISGEPQLREFYRYTPDIQGISEAIAQRKQFKVDRNLLVTELQQQYNSVPPSEKVNKNIQLLRDEDTFVITTAHQPAIFTGNLFFVYKILHAIRLAEYLKQHFPSNEFVPVYYMGSEDADLEELGHIFMNGEKIRWDTNQSGAVGRMNTKGLDKVIHRVEGELMVQAHGRELMEMIRECYLNCPDIQTATLKLVHHLFAEYGLVVFIPDSPAYKKKMVEVFEDELLNHRAAGFVDKTIQKLGEHFKVQAHPRAINLFYLKDNIRQRIEKTDEGYQVVDTELRFSEKEILDELREHPERFSPNVILRGIMQESLLPGIAFVGGGGELAYWLELRSVFDLYKVHYPVLVVRNSFLIIEEKWKSRLEKLQVALADVFREEQDLLNQLVKRQSTNQLSLAGEITDVTSHYDKLKHVASQVDDTLSTHVAALQVRAIKPLQELEKKLIRAEKKKFEIEARHLSAVKNALFPNNSLQERVDNFMPYYAKWGKEFLRNIYAHSLPLDQQFTILVCS